MPHWSSDVPARDGPRSMQLQRTPTSGKLIAVITSPDLEGCPTHFFRGHTMPCTSPNCEACLTGIPWAWHGYVGAMAAGTRQHFLFEFTPQVGDILKDYRKHHGTLRGCIFTAQRHNSRPNGRVILQTKPGDLAALNLPDPPDLIACMAIIWNLNKNNVVRGCGAKGSPSIYHELDNRTIDRLKKKEDAKKDLNKGNGKSRKLINPDPEAPMADRILDEERARRNGH